MFRVSRSGDNAGHEFALKRLKKSDRLDRFMAEIEALKRIYHPNVIRIVDHSTPEDLRDEKEPTYWFVMPKAEGRDLSKRLPLYKDSIDATLSVAIQLTEALRAAHSAGIIHRDVKPANILFAGSGHDLWLSDFGICHTVDSERLTPDGRVMGPRGFTAPEIESGVDHVTPAADIYSLGKVIYYMISGGMVIAREERDAAFHDLGTKGQRYRLLQILLSRMIALLPSRINDIDMVLRELVAIQEWEKTAVQSSLSSSLLATIDHSQQAAINRDRINRDNEAARNNLAGRVQAVADDISSWVEGELLKAKDLMDKSGFIRSRFRASRRRRESV